MTVMENELNEGEIISFLLAQFRHSKSMSLPNSEFYSVQKEFKCEFVLEKYLLSRITKTQNFFSLHALRRRTPSGVFICFWNSNFRTSRIGKSDRRIAIFRLSLTFRNFESYRQKKISLSASNFIPNDIFYYLNCSFFFLLLLDRSAIMYYL